MPDVQWQIPSEYLRGNYGGKSDGSILLRIRITDFAPFVPEYTGERTEISKNFGTLLIRSIVSTERIAILKLGLTNSLTEEVSFAPALSKAREAEFGLKQFLREDFPSRSFFPADFYVAVSESDVTDVISCSRRGEVPYPQCWHEMRTENADIKLHYDLEYLKNWKSIKGRVNRFLDCAHVTTE